ncbi:hypothetical protein PL8927_50181 [Planktothrix serta PCC 8927]|uniref:Uncharacterized protein n=1 Tax=Planktothrix serta PCC 8927 TaxID=671068 RepID=A0A7Z9BMF0_9CYAN|nr:hypothetical protein PL8927_50181 [Planktothrix serta PCC 8927]
MKPAILLAYAEFVCVEISYNPYQGLKLLFKCLRVNSLC